MNSVFEITVAVFAGNLLSISFFTAVNAYFAKKQSAKRRAELDALLDKMNINDDDYAFTEPAKPVKKTASAKRVKKQ